MSNEKKEKCLFLDRDGVICEALPRGEYLVDLSEFKLVVGIKELVMHAKQKGYRVCVVTNQPQISKGLLSIEKLHDIHTVMAQEIEGIDAVYYCPHKNEDNCECRKPKPGMVLKAVAEFNIDPAQSLLVGDSDKDIGAGHAAGCKTVFLKNKHNEAELAICEPHSVVDDLFQIHRLL